MQVLRNVYYNRNPREFLIWHVKSEMNYPIPLDIWCSIYPSGRYNSDKCSPIYWTYTIQSQLSCTFEHNLLNIVWCKFYLTSLATGSWRLIEYERHALESLSSQPTWTAVPEYQIHPRGSGSAYLNHFTLWYIGWYHTNCLALPEPLCNTIPKTYSSSIPIIWHIEWNKLLASYTPQTCIILLSD